MNKNQLKELVESVLKDIDLYSQDCVNLILGTIAQESALGYYIEQISGPALGICQMEPNTFNDIMNNYLNYRDSLKNKILKTCNISEFKSESLKYNMALAICMCRIHYLRVSESIPNNVEGCARYWKKYYNTCLGKGTEEEFINNYNKYINA